MSNQSKPKLTFGEKPAPTPKPPKGRELTRGEQIAAVGGYVSGIPDSLAKAVAALNDVIARCERAKSTTGILTHGQAQVISNVDAGTAQIIDTLTEMQRDTHAMHFAGIGVEKERVGLL